MVKDIACHHQFSAQRQVLASNISMPLCPQLSSSSLRTIPPLSGHRSFQTLVFPSVSSPLKPALTTHLLSQRAQSSFYSSSLPFSANFFSLHTLIFFTINSFLSLHCLDWPRITSHKGSMCANETSQVCPDQGMKPT